MKESKFNIAVLIDGDNAQAKLIKEVLQEVSKYGKATIRRIYGDWTSPNMNSWKDVLNIHSVSPIQKFSYTSGKNSTDSSLIIDAMDILHSKSVEGFCIVSSDSDYTGLAKRIREEGLFVMGIGKHNTPIAFVNSCEIFTFTEILNVESDSITEQSKSFSAKNEIKKPSETKSRPSEKNKFPAIDNDIIDKAFEISSNEGYEVHISKIGLALRKIDPSFDPRTYGFKTLTQLFESLSNYTVIENKVNGSNHPLVKQNDLSH
ncbi:NYN domain-containing protein [Hymenobacter lucidus]|uniref:NYN domain-containing protein n=1 Tax=Hymenobacter lucidus TaxID=2880930 RepID=A0ABS8ARM8_9BACT|nr:NYN domain-containing protein [Hymenobacter lucidus]MCB2408865.1 NYN domain-containing protein [Hymenobacter lucidus]